METDIHRLVLDYAPVIIATIAPVVVDAIVGALPDRWVPYVGACRRIIRKAWTIYKEKKKS